MGVINRSVRHLPPYPHPPILKEAPLVHPGFQFTSLPFGQAMAPQIFIIIVKEEKLMALTMGVRLHQYLDNWLIRALFQEEYSDHGGPDKSLGWIINQENSKLKPTQVFSFVGYEYHLDSALVKHTQDRWLKLQDLILHLKSKLVLTARYLMLLIGLLASMEKMVPEGRLYMKPFQLHLKEHWRYPQSLEILLPEGSPSLPPHCITAKWVGAKFPTQRRKSCGISLLGHLTSVLKASGQYYMSIFLGLWPDAAAF